MVDQSSKQDAKPEPLIISELRVNARASGWLFAAEVLTRKTSTGKPYLDLKLRDQRGNEITGRYFDPPGTEAYLSLQGKVVEVEGVVEKFLNQRGHFLTRNMKCPLLSYSSKEWECRGVGVSTFQLFSGRVG